jgi:hypothetical protein
MSVNWYETRTPEQWAALAADLREHAVACCQRADESFDRCDTDGFLSQWASQSQARHYHACAALADAQGWSSFRALFTLTGELVSQRIIDGKYGVAWLTTDDHVNAGGPRFVNPSRARSAQKRYDALRRKGYTVGTVQRRAGVFKREGGPWQLYDAVEPLRDAPELEIVTSDNGVQADD